MEGKRFKVLMHNGIFVDHTKLCDGIYEVKVPEIYSMNATVEARIKMSEVMVQKLPGLRKKGWHDKYAENISKCEFKVVTLTIEDSCSNT